MRPKVDFALLCHNRVESAIAAIDSMLAQEGVDSQVFVLDQNSDTGPLRRLQDRCAGDPRVTLHCSPINLGVPAGRNKVHGLGSAPYVIWLDDDARFVDSGQAARAIAMAERDAAIAAVGFRFVNEDGSETSESKEMERRALKGLFVAFIGAGFLLRRSAIEVAGGFDQRLFFYHEETDLCMRLVGLGYKLAYAADVTAVHPFGLNPSARRVFFDVRNTVYLEGKYNFSLAVKRRSIENAVRRSARGEYPMASLRGLAAGALMWPAAFAQRLVDRRLRLKPEIREHIRPSKPWPKT